MHFVSTILSVHGAPKAPGEDERCVTFFTDDNDNSELLISVMDGCGGAGGKKYPQADNWTGARLASHEAGRALVRWFRSSDNEDSVAQQAEKMRDALKDAFDRLSAPLNKASIVKHNMGATMPTTLSAVTARLVEPRRILLRYFWAGDSRGYLLKADGLHQITRDDNVGNLDPYEDLMKDCVLSNVVCAGKRFDVNAWETEVTDPCIIFSASDGVFSYFGLSPIELEGMLFRTMMRTNAPAEWETALRGEIGAIAGDDHTLQLAVLGFQTYTAIKEAYSDRWKVWQERFGKKLEKCRMMDDPSDELARLWVDYKDEYLRRT